MVRGPGGNAALLIPLYIVAIPLRMNGSRELKNLGGVFPAGYNDGDRHKLEEAPVKLAEQIVKTSYNFTPPPLGIQDVLKFVRVGEQQR